MIAALSLPRLVFGSGSLSQLTAELLQLGVHRPLLISDRGLERAGIVAKALAAMPAHTSTFLDVPENPTTDGADAALQCYRATDADGVVALGGGSVLDSAKIVAALAHLRVQARSLVGKSELIVQLAPLVAIPTTLGTGSESSPVAALHIEIGGTALGTRSHLLVPKVALCDPDLARTLPRRLIAATGIDALSHCIEGFFAEPESPFIDALALDGIARVFDSLDAALATDGDAARTSLMAAAYAGGIAINKGLGPAHAVALACSDQDLHHGTLIAVALPAAVSLVTPHFPHKAARLAAALGARDSAEVAIMVRKLTAAVGLPHSLTHAGYHGEVQALTDRLIRSPFNRTSPYVPSAAEYRQMAVELLA